MKPRFRLILLVLLLVVLIAAVFIIADANRRGEAITSGIQTVVATDNMETAAARITEFAPATQTAIAIEAQNILNTALANAQATAAP